MTHTTDQLKDLLAKVTPGEWLTEPGSKSCHCCFMDSIYVKTGPGEYDYDLIGETFADSSCDATLIALAPTLAAEVVRLREVLEDIARQKKSTEFATTQGCMDADFEGGFDECVSRARQALDATREK